MQRGSRCTRLYVGIMTLKVDKVLDARYVVLHFLVHHSGFNTDRDGNK